MYIYIYIYNILLCYIYMYTYTHRHILGPESERGAGAHLFCSPQLQTNISISKGRQ